MVASSGSGGARTTTAKWASAVHAAATAVDPWASSGVMRAAVEPGIEQRFDPFSQTWTEAAVWVRIDADEFARGSVRYCFRAKVQSADDATNAVYGKLRARLDALPGMTDDVVAAIASKIDAADSSPTVGDLLAALEADPEKAVHEAVFACLVDESARTALKEELAEIELHRPAMESRWTHPGCNRIAKCYIKEGLTVDEACRATEEDIVCQSVAKAWAEAYNRANAVPGSISGVSKAKTPKHPPKKVDFVALTLLRLTSRPDDGSKGESVYALEAVIEGDYRKYNNNAGMLVSLDARDAVCALASCSCFSGLVGVCCLYLSAVAGPCMCCIGGGRWRMCTDRRRRRCHTLFGSTLEAA